MTTSDALAEREALRAERQHARDVQAEARAEREAVEVELREIPKARAAAEREQVRTGEAGDLAALDQRERELAAEAERLGRQAKAAGAVASEAERKLVALHHDRFAEFAEAAEALTVEASEKLAAIEAGYREAWEAARAAEREWSAIVLDFNRVLRDRSDPASRVSGEVKRRAISPPTPSPLRDPGSVFGAPPPRPPEVEPVEATDAPA